MNRSPQTSGKLGRIFAVVMLATLATARAGGIPHEEEHPQVPQERKIPEPTAAAVLALLGGIVLVRRWKTGAR